MFDILSNFSDQIEGSKSLIQKFNLHNGDIVQTYAKIESAIFLLTQSLVSIDAKGLDQLWI